MSELELKIRRQFVADYLSLGTKKEFREWFELGNFRGKANSVLYYIKYGYFKLLLWVLI